MANSKPTQGMVIPWTLTTVLGLGGLLGAAGACGGSKPPVDAAPSPVSAVPPPASIQSPPAPASSAESAQSKASALPARAQPLWRVTQGLATPESVLYDESNDRYLVSNINGKPLERDGNGYLSELSPEGLVLRERFIAGGVNQVKLDAPKGSGILDGILYVTDITVVRQFDLKTGAPKGQVPVPGATFLNDISVGRDGRVYVSDSGLKAGKDGSLEPTGTDAVYVIDKRGAVKPVAKSKDLGQPNGLFATDRGVLVVTFGANELYRLDEQGKRQDVTLLPFGSLDGVVSLGDALLVSSWKGSAIYRGSLGGKFDLAFSDLEAPADIGLDTKRGRLLVPRFMQSVVEAYQVK